jgi:DNA-binding MarR family transcriptional regulator
MNADKDKMMLAAVFLLTIALVFYFGVDSRISLYLIVVAVLLILSTVVKGGKIKSMENVFQDKQEKTNLSEKEKKILVAYILHIIHDKKSIRLDELSSDTNIKMKVLKGVINSLEKRGMIKLMYPPMQRIPVIVEVNPMEITALSQELMNSVKGDTDELKNYEFMQKVSEVVAKVRK